MKFFENEIECNLNTDKILYQIDEPTMGTDRRREELRVNEAGIKYLHTNNDREEEMIITSNLLVEGWIEENKIKVEELQNVVDKNEGLEFMDGGFQHKIENGEVLFDYNTETGKCNEEGGKLDLEGMTEEQLKSLYNCIIEA